MTRRKLPPIHPGEVLQEEFLMPLGISQYRLAKDTSVPPRRINEIIQGSRAISADTALRLARYFGTSERFWLNLQGRYDLEVAKDRLGSRLQREVKRAPLGSTAGDKHMSYAADNVFPLKEVYSFAQGIGGELAAVILAIKDWRDFPEDLRWSPNGGFSQVRRALCYLALKQHGRWEQFVSQCWPTAPEPIITELETALIDSGRLSEHAHALPPEARTLLRSRQRV